MKMIKIMMKLEMITIGYYNDEDSLGDEFDEDE